MLYKRPYINRVSDGSNARPLKSVPRVILMRHRASGDLFDVSFDVEIDGSRITAQDNLGIKISLFLTVADTSTEMQIRRMALSPKHITEFPEPLYDTDDEQG